MNKNQLTVIGEALKASLQEMLDDIRQSPKKMVIVAVLIFTMVKICHVIGFGQVDSLLNEHQVAKVEEILQQKLLLTLPNSPYADKIKTRLADTYLLSEEFDKAIGIIEEIENRNKSINHIKSEMS